MGRLRAGAASASRALGGDLLGALAPYAQWTSSATHAVLPLLATDAGVRVQVQTGVAPTARASRATWRGGFWLPECALRALARADARRRRRARHLRRADRPPRARRARAPAPIVGEAGAALVPIDRATIELVWSDEGYPAARRLPRLPPPHRSTTTRPGRTTASAYDHERALALAARARRDFVARTRERLQRDGAGLPGGGLVVCALDTELLGHWWYEGIAGCEAVVEECARQGLELVRLDDAFERLEPAPLPRGIADERGARRAAGARTATSRPGRGRRWPSSRSRRARPSSQVVAAGAGGRPGGVRELLALQSSDWAFMVSRELAVPYARERFEGHRRARSTRALEQGADAGRRGAGCATWPLHADPAALLAP